MTLRRFLVGTAAASVLAALGSTLFQSPPLRAEGPTAPPAVGSGLPALDADYALPPVPKESLRNANYEMEARLDPVKHTLDGKLVLTWRNITDRPLDTFPFHLYWNAFRNNLSTSAREARAGGTARRRAEDERDYGFIHVTSIRLLGDAEADLTKTLRYLQPDDTNADDRTVMEVKTEAPVAPGATVRFAIDWNSVIPYGTVGRSGWVHDYHFIVQWFPKIGVFSKGEWNAHQFHATSEFFADYGNYDVRITLPKGFVVGATGRRAEAKDNGDGTETLRYAQDDVHDFAWTASRRFLEKSDRFADPGYPPVDIRLLVQPEHEHLAQRYIESTKTALRSYGAWSAPYPYAQITVVDPAWNSASGGMEYPTLLTGGTRYFAPEILHSPEAVTVHEAGHQFWYGLVGNNEFEEAWLDEGFNSYHEEKATWLWRGPEGVGRYYFGPAGGRGGRTGWPVVAPGVLLGRGISNLAGLRSDGTADAMARRAWEYRNRASYGLNSYGKPALSLQTLEALVGDAMMTRILRTYARRYRFSHPTSQDFISTVNEVTGQDWRWYFANTWFSSGLCDYAVSVRKERPPAVAGYRDGKDGAPERVTKEAAKRDEAWDSEVTVERRGEVRMPVDLRVVFADGTTKDETWDGQYRWMRFSYPGRKVVGAFVDPERKLAIDADPSNNSWVEDKGEARRAAGKWAALYLFWLQNLFELHTVLG